MEMQWNQTQCRYLRELVHQVQHLEQTQELRLPDGMPDIGRILCAWGQSMVRSKQWNGDHMLISGGVTAWILYAPEDGSEPRSLELWLPFTGKWNLPDARREGMMCASCQLRDLDARTLSARKCMVRATVGVLAQAWEGDEVSISTPPEDRDGIELLENTYPAMLPTEAGEKLFTIAEPVPTTVVPRKILSCDVQPVVLEQNAAGNKVVFRGVCRVHVVYMGEDDRPRGTYHDLPFAQLAELDRDYDKDATATVCIAVTGLETDLEQDQIHIKCSLVGQYLVYRRMLLHLAQDAYSPLRPVRPICQDLRLPMLLEHTAQTLEWQQDLPLPVAEVVDLTLRQEYPTQYRDGNTVMLELPYQLQTLYYDGEGNLRSHSHKGHGQLAVAAGEGCDVYAEALPARAPEGIMLVDKLRTDSGLRIHLTTSSCQPIPMLTGLELGAEQAQDPQRPSLILQRLDKGSLWELAKACGSTVDAIRRANCLTEDPDPEKMLLIPIL